MAKKTDLEETVAKKTGMIKKEGVTEPPVKWYFLHWWDSGRYITVCVIVRSEWYLPGELPSIIAYGTAIGNPKKEVIYRKAGNKIALERAVHAIVLNETYGYFGIRLERLIGMRFAGELTMVPATAKEKAWLRNNIAWENACVKRPED